MWLQHVLPDLTTRVGYVGGLEWFSGRAPTVAKQNGSRCEFLEKSSSDNFNIKKTGQRLRDWQKLTTGCCKVEQQFRSRFLTFEGQWQTFFEEGKRVAHQWKEKKLPKNCRRCLRRKVAPKAHHAEISREDLFVGWFGATRQGRFPTWCRRLKEENLAEVTYRTQGRAPWNGSEPIRSNMRR